MNRNDSILAIYPSHTAAEAAVKELHKAGFEMKQLSIVGREFHTDEQVVGYYNTADRMKVWSRMGAFWGGLCGLLFGSTFFWIPEFGTFSNWFIGTLGGAIAAGSLSAMGAAFYSLGAPKDTILRYEKKLKSDNKFVLMAHGSADEVIHAQEILNRTRPRYWGTLGKPSTKIKQHLQLARTS